MSDPRHGWARITAVSTFLLLLCVSTASASVTLRWGTWGEPIELEIWGEWAREFSERYGVEVQIEDANNIPVKHAGGAAPDLIRFSARNAYAFASQGILEPLTAFVNRDFHYPMEDWLPGALQYVTYQGDVYGIPPSYSTYMIFYHQDMFQEAGLPEPDWSGGGWTWNDLESAARRLIRYSSAGDVIRWGFGFAEYERPLLSVIWQNGGRIWNDDLSASVINSPQAKEAAEFLVNFVQNMEVSPPPGLIHWRNGFFDRQTAITMDISSMRGTFSRNPNIKPAVMPIKENRSSWTTTSSWGIWSQSQHKELVWELIKFITERERILRFGGYGADDGILIPAFRSIFRDPEWHPTASTLVVTEQLTYGRAEPVPDLAATENTLSQWLVEALSGRISSSEAIEQMALALDALATQW